MITWFQAILLVIAMAVAFAVSAIVIKWLVKLLKNRTFIGFGIYRIALGIVLIGILYTVNSEDLSIGVTANTQLIVADNNTEEDMLSNLNIQKQKAAMCYEYMNTAEVREAVCNYLAPTYKDDISDASKKDNAMEKLSKQYSIGLDGSSSMLITVSTETPKKQQSIDLANAFVNVTYSLANGSGTLSPYLKGSLAVSETATAINVPGDEPCFFNDNEFLYIVIRIK